MNHQASDNQNEEDNRVLIIGAGNHVYIYRFVMVTDTSLV